ncbi:MAG: helix-turn-helix domain-containing protein [Clostridia bacterium]|nr:helix-turn-helix domain-containing protein [Clostridia bacterium]
MEIGSKLKNARNEKGITQEQAAELLGVSRQTISNWENNKSYPDIISVIKMSNIYSVSLDHLLKEEITVKQTYQEFLEESTNTVKARRNLEKIILLSAYFIVWIAAMIVFWQINGPLTAALDIVFRWLLLPLLLLAATVTIAKHNYWGRGNWLSVVGAAITFLTIPYTEYVEQAGEAMFTFCFPNFGYMAVGIAVALCGLAIGTMWNGKKRNA